MKIIITSVNLILVIQDDLDFVHKRNTQQLIIFLYTNKCLTKSDMAGVFLDFI